MGAFLKESGHEFIFLDLKEFDLPHFDEDLEESIGTHENAEKLNNIIKSSNGLIIVTPEYNSFMPGVLKNAIDWLSRFSPHVFTRRPVLLFAASPGALGGIRALTVTRQLLSNLGSFVYPEFFALGKADEMLNDQGKIKDIKTAERIKKLLAAYVQFTEKLKE